MLGKIPSLALFSFVLSCASVPKNAPQEFYDAQASLKRMDQTKSKQYFPKSAARANSSFKQSLKMLNESSKPEQKFSQAEAIDKAVNAKVLADNVTGMSEKIKAWDSNEAQLQSAVTTLDTGINATMDIGIEPIEKPVVIPSEFENLRGSEFVANLAYFASGKGDHALYYLNDAMNALVKTLEKNPNLKVTLTGYADPTGNRDFNRTLALVRAQTVAQELKSKGSIPDDQIITKGEIDESVSSIIEKRKGKSTQADLPFSRRVQAKIVLPQ